MPQSFLYHNPRCSKSRQAINYLQEQQQAFEIVEYLKVPLTYSQLEQLYQKLRLSGAINTAHDMLRPKEAEYKLAGLVNTSSDEEVLNAIVQYPKLLERPILETPTKAAIGRPLDNIAALVIA